MDMISKLFQGQDGLRIFGWMAACALATTAVAQAPAPRIRSEVNNSVVTTLKSSQQPLAQMQTDAGRMPADVKLNGMSIVFNRSAAQQADLEALLAAQQDPNSPQYHQWLSPEQFAARFGMAQSDIDKVQTWLQQQGFSIDSVARSKNMIRFSGTVGQVEQAFQTQMHYYGANGEKHFAPSTPLSVPAAIAPTIEVVRNLSNFRPRPLYVKPRTAFTSGQSGAVFFAPGDIAVTYDINPLYSGGVDGTGQSIAIVGQSNINPTDIANFQAAAGLPNNPPTLVLVPGSGTATINAGGDEGESDLDIQWAGAIAKKATINFVFTGCNANPCSNSTMNAFDSIAYAIDEKIAPIISISYGACEPATQLPPAFSQETLYQQAATQGQTILAASGDQGSTACQGDTNGLSTTVQTALAVNYPASSPYVTAVGGTSITTDDSGSFNSSGTFIKGANYSTYWSTNGSNDVLTSAKQWIPEVVWNDDALSVGVSPSAGGGLSASGGGISALFAQPSYQTSYFTTTGQANPSSSHRLVPDVALYSSPDLPGYLYCTSDTSNWQSGQQGSCDSPSTSGFRDSATGDLTVAGGTSFATPIFAGMIALINQKQQWTAGQGQANINLYKLASNSTTYAAAFHDVTSGNNYCTAGTQYGYCASNGSTLGFTAGPGYDMVTGLGSVDLNALAGVWPTNSSALIGTTTTVQAQTTAPNTGANDMITIAVSGASGSTPTGTVNLSIDGSGTSYGATGSTFTALTLTSNGTVTYTANFATAGAHTIVAQYAGDSTHAASTGSIVLNVAGTTSGKGSFTMAFSPTTLTVAQGSSQTVTLTVTPSGGYTGTINLSVTLPSALQNLCGTWGTGFTTSGSSVSIAVSGANPVTGQLTIDTNASDCATAAVSHGTGGRNVRLIPHKNGLKASNDAPKKSNPLPAGIAFAGLLLAGFLGRSSRKLRQLACVVALASLGLALSACGGTSSNNTVPNPPKGTYTVTVSGTDSVTSTINSSANFTLVIN
jgi:subtilase family serine protease